MRVACRDERLASLRLVYALDEAEFFEFFESAINGDQPESAVFFSSGIEDLDGGDGARGILHGFDDCAARAGDAVSIFLQLGQPGLRCHNASFFEIENHFQ